MRRLEGHGIQEEAAQSKNKLKKPSLGSGKWKCWEKHYAREKRAKK